MKKIYLLLLLLTPLLLNAQARFEMKTPAKSQRPRIPAIIDNYSPSSIISIPEPNTKFGIRCLNMLAVDTTRDEPLIIIDDFPFDGTLKDITLKPSEIESITILKDQAASKLWVCNRASGFIVIKTKRIDSATRGPRQATVKQGSAAGNTNAKTKFAIRNAPGSKIIYKSNSTEPFNLLLVNTNGQVLRTWKNSNGVVDRYEFDIAGIPPGIYIVILKAAGKKWSQKILINQ